MCFRKTRIDQPGPSQARSDKTRPNRTGPNPDPCRIPAALRRVSRSPPLTHASRRLLMCRAVTWSRSTAAAGVVGLLTYSRQTRAGRWSCQPRLAELHLARLAESHRSETGRVGLNMSQSQAWRAQAEPRRPETARDGQRRPETDSSDGRWSFFRAGN